MNFLNVGFIFCLSIFLSSCQNEISHKNSVEDEVSNKAIISIGKKLENKYNLSLGAIGGGAKDGIWLLTAGFTRHGKYLKLNESRLLIVEITQDYLKDINDNQELKPYLKVYPFTTSNLYVFVINLEKNGEEVKDPYIGSMSAREGIINYKTNDPCDEYKYKFKFKETFEEAVAKLQQEFVL